VICGCRSSAQLNLGALDRTALSQWLTAHVPCSAFGAPASPRPESSRALPSKVGLDKCLSLSPVPAQLRTRLRVVLSGVGLVLETQHT
jgi:hypothetical protein